MQMVWWVPDLDKDWLWQALRPAAVAQWLAGDLSGTSLC